MSQDNMSREESAALEHIQGPHRRGESIRRYVEDLRTEMRQVSWPTWHQVRSTTFVVLFFAFAMAAFMGIVSGICEFLYRLIDGR